MRDALGFEHELLLRGALQSRSFPWGFAALATTSWKLVVVRPVEADVVITAAVREVPVAAGQDELVVAIECLEPASELIALMAAAGFEDSIELLMAHDGRDRLSADALAVRRLDGPTMDAAWVAARKRSRPGSTAQGAAQRARATRAFYERASEVSNHAIETDGAWVSRCECYLMGKVAQVSAVMTDPPYEGRGFATAVILDAIAHARARGAEHVFLRTDASDWPQHLYRRLGFVDLGTVHTMSRGTAT